MTPEEGGLYYVQDVGSDEIELAEFRAGEFLFFGTDLTRYPGEVRIRMKVAVVKVAEHEPGLSAPTTRRSPMTDLRSKLIGKSYALENWITDRYEDWPKPIRDWWDQAPDGMFAPYLCSIFGHVPEADHCGMPEHDCCVWCHKLTPFQAGNVPERLLKRLHWYLKDPELSARITEKLGENGLNRRGHQG